MIFTGTDCSKSCGVKALGNIWNMIVMVRSHGHKPEPAGVRQEVKTDYLGDDPAQPCSLWWCLANLSRVSLCCRSCSALIPPRQSSEPLGPYSDNFVKGSDISASFLTDSKQGAHEKKRRRENLQDNCASLHDNCSSLQDNCRATRTNDISVPRGFLNKITQYGNVKVSRYIVCSYRNTCFFQFNSSDVFCDSNSHRTIVYNANYNP
ncbi:hypothetical protein ACOMHN_032939 [Nucella lapillus]